MPLLTIAASTEWEITVHDVREDRQWSHRSGPKRIGPPASLFLHHTVSRLHEEDEAIQYATMARWADTFPYGLPYNFLIFPSGDDPRIWYLNDVDWPYPHTYGHNPDVALSVVGNYEVDIPSHALVTKVVRWLGAMRSLWGLMLPFRGHRDVYPTACPGANLYGLTQEY